MTKKHPKKKSAGRFIIPIVILVTIGGIIGGSFAIRLDRIDCNGCFYADRTATIQTVFPNDSRKNLGYAVFYNFFGNKEEGIFSSLKVRLKGLTAVEIRAEEIPAFGAVISEKGYLIINAEGYIIGEKSENTEKLPVFSRVTVLNPVPFKKVEAEDPLAFQSELRTLRVLMSENLVPDMIYVENGQVLFTFGKVTVNFGDTENLQAKAAELSGLQAYYKDRSGVLHMENFNLNEENRYYFEVIY